MTLKKKTIRGKQYFYLDRRLTFQGKTYFFEKYVGRTTTMLADIQRQQEEDIFATVFKPYLSSIFKKHSKKKPKTLIEKNIHAFSIHFTYESNKIEGSTLTLRETYNLIDNKTSPRKPIHQIEEALGHKKAFDYLIFDNPKLSLGTLLHLHKYIFSQSNEDIAGKLRQHQVLIAGSTFTPPQPVEVYPLLEEFFLWYNYIKDYLHPVLLAALVHLKLVTIHPFVDGNGRVSRLLMNSILFHSGYPMINIHYKNRNSYYNALEKSQTKEEAFHFITWFMKQYVKEFL